MSEANKKNEATIFYLSWWDGDETEYSSFYEINTNRKNVLNLNKMFMDKYSECDYTIDDYIAFFKSQGYKVKERTDILEITI